eukprot:6762375-Lingulodinium_polyedra.AAC.1
MQYFLLAAGHAAGLSVATHGRSPGLRAGPRGSPLLPDPGRQRGRGDGDHGPAPARHCCHRQLGGRP